MIQSVFICIFIKFYLVALPILYWRGGLFRFHRLNQLHNLHISCKRIANGFFKLKQSSYQSFDFTKRSFTFKGLTNFRTESLAFCSFIVRCWYFWFCFYKVLHRNFDFFQPAHYTWSWRNISKFNMSSCLTFTDLSALISAFFLSLRHFEVFKHTQHLQPSFYLKIIDPEGKDATLNKWTRGT